MHLFVTLLHVMLCFTLILVILLQPGKDGASVFGGSASGNQMYGPRGQAHFLGRATTVVAALFMVTSITLAFYGSRQAQQGSDIDDDILRLEQEEAARRESVPPATPVPDAPVEGASTPVEGTPTPAQEGSAAP